jgi:hypothetical protein
MSSTNEYAILPNPQGSLTNESLFNLCAPAWRWVCDRIREQLMSGELKPATSSPASANWPAAGASDAVARDRRCGLLEVQAWWKARGIQGLLVFSAISDGTQS